MAKNKKPAAKKSAARPTPKKVSPAAKKSAPNQIKSAKSASAAKKPNGSNGSVKTAAAAKPAKNSTTMEKPSKKSALRDSILKRKSATKPIAFSLDEVRAIAKTVTSKTKAPFDKDKAGAKVSAKAPVALEKPAKPNHIKA